MTESTWKGKSVLITGCCGTVGRELLRQIVKEEPGEVVGLDNNESALYFLQGEYRHDPGTRFYLGDTRDADALYRKMDGVEIVLHTAALKHVYLCEESPREAIQTNIQGVQNVVDAALACDVERVVFTSSDKAVNPTSVMGTSKLMGERLMTAANSMRRNSRPIFTSTRFGNVLGSRGSVIPVFQRQIDSGGPVTLTHSEMTRFIMTLEEAVRLVMDSVFLAKGGEVFVTKMPTIRIAELARVMIEELAPLAGRDPDDIRVEMIGPRPGEKLYEELMNEEEIRRTIELERYFVVKPAFQSVFHKIDYRYTGVIADELSEAYNSSSETPMDREALRTFLRENDLLTSEEEPGSPSPPMAIATA